MNKANTVEVVSDVSDDPQLVVLLKDYELLVEKHSRSEERFLQIIGWVIVILGTITSFVFGQTGISQIDKTSAWLAWGGPFIAVFLFYLLLWEFFQLEGYIRRCRVVAEQINYKFGEAIMVQFSPDTKMTSFLSSRHGNIRYALVFWVLMTLSAILYVLTITVSLSTIYRENHLGGFAISIVVSVATLALLYSFLGAIMDLPKHYDRIFQEVKKTGKVPQLESQNPAKPTPFQIGLKSLYRIILPRNNLVEKGVMFWYGFIGAFAITGVQQSQVDLINIFFRQDKDYTLNTIPWWLILGLGVIYFFVEELLLQQAKYLWNDIRDQDWDLKNPYRQDRAFAEGLISGRWTILHIVIRWTLTLTLGYMLGGWQLFLLFVLVSLHQAIYVLWGKPRGDKHPIILLTIISFNVAPRFIAGVMAVSGALPITMPMLVLFAIFHFFSFGFMAAYWKMEAVEIQNNKNSKSKIPERPQSKYFLDEGEGLQHQGFIAAVISSLALLIGYFLSNKDVLQAVSCYLVRHISDFFLCTNLDGALALVLVVCFILSVHLLTIFLRKVFSWLGKYINTVILKMTPLQ
jgi:hypothetical protein